LVKNKGTGPYFFVPVRNEVENRVPTMDKIPGNRHPLDRNPGNTSLGRIEPGEIFSRWPNQNGDSG
jgi:hypothetical protein